MLFYFEKLSVGNLKGILIIVTFLSPASLSVQQHGKDLMFLIKHLD